MTYYYSDPARESEPHALPDVEVFQSKAWIDDIDGTIYFSLGDIPDEIGRDSLTYWPNSWFYAYGFIGCLWDSEPMGPFASESEALDAARDY